jgi:chemotaxis protein MotB
MSAKRSLVLLGWLLWTGVGPGCTADTKARMAGLENQNKSLHDQLKRAREDLVARQRALEDAERRRLAAEQEANQLRGQLASLPTPREAAPGWTPVPGGAMIAIAENLLFAPGKATLRSEARKNLESVVSTIQGEYSNKDILVFGHTDTQPIQKSGWEDNWELSAERSLAVVRYLRERGVAANRLVAAGAGEHWPRADNRTEEGKARNRRVEIFAIDHAQLHPTK